MLLFRWFLSRQVRHAYDACRHVHKLLRSQRDLLSAEAIAAVRAGVQGLRESLGQGTPPQITDKLAQLEALVQKHLRPYPYAKWRENTEVFLVTAAVVLALRTFFFQPMAIPSGSAQPTLWGIMAYDYRGQADVQFPGAFQRFIDKWWSGISYFHIVAKEDGELHNVSPPKLVFPFLRMQTFQVGNASYRIFFSSSFEDMVKRGLGMRDPNGPVPYGVHFRAGEDIIKMKVTAGDHLFVNRMVYNFRPPKRGEIIVFSSEGIPRLIPNTHYIKRLVGLPGERIRLGNDRHLVINDVRLDASTPGFENLYSFDPKQPPKENVYSGHVNGAVAAMYRRAIPAELFPDGNAVFTVPPDQYLAMGDNTMNSHDGRSWGSFPREKVVGRSSFVFWPISSRFGFGYH